MRALTVYFIVGFFYGGMGFTGNFHGTFAYVLHRSSKAEEENDERFHSTV